MPGHTKHDNPCILKAADDEPLFVLRARDLTAGATIRSWLAINMKRLKEDKIKDTEEVLKEIQEWQETHGGRYPD